MRFLCLQWAAESLKYYLMFPNSIEDCIAALVLGSVDLPDLLFAVKRASGLQENQADFRESAGGTR
jgi:hypothetical protein